MKNKSTKVAKAIVPVPQQAGDSFTEKEVEIFDNENVVHTSNFADTAPFVDQKYDNPPTDAYIPPEGMKVDTSKPFVLGEKVNLVSREADAASAKDIIVQPKTTPFASHKDVTAPESVKAKTARREDLKYQLGTKYCFTNADTSFIGEFESFDPDLVLRDRVSNGQQDPAYVQGFDARNFQITKASKADTDDFNNATKPHTVVKKHVDGEIYQFTRDKETFLGKTKNGQVFRCDRRGGCLIETPVEGKASDFTFKLASREDVQSLKQIPEPAFVG